MGRNTTLEGSASTEFGTTPSKQMQDSKSAADQESKSKYHWYHFFLRVLSTVIFSLAVVGCTGNYFTQTSLFDAGAAFDLAEEALDSNVYTFTLSGSGARMESFSTWMPAVALIGKSRD